MDRKPSLLEKMGLAKREIIPDDAMPEYPTEEAYEPQPQVEVDSSQISATDVIRSIYAQGNVREETSLMRLEGFISSLPKEMPTETKQHSIAGILKFSGFDIYELIDDGKERLALLTAAKESLQTAHAQRNAEVNANIEQLKQAIQEAERQMAEDKHTTDTSCDAIDVEAAQLNALLQFADGVAQASNGG